MLRKNAICLVQPDSKKAGGTTYVFQGFRFMRRGRSAKRGSRTQRIANMGRAIGVCFPPLGQRTNDSAEALLLFVKDGDVVDLLALCVCAGRCIG